MLVVCVAPSSSGTRESGDVRALRPNRSSKAVIYFTVETRLAWYVSSIKCSGYVFYSTSLIMICFGRISLLCCAASIDVSVSASRARMVDVVFAGASAAVEELAISPPY